jgi:hypothetical protein
MLPKPFKQVKRMIPVKVVTMESVRIGLSEPCDRMNRKRRI